MILWTFKLISSVRKAIAGRRYPSQLAWAVAFGLLLGLIPHGNLVALVVLMVVLVLQLNHAMAALTAIGVTLLAPKLDPIFHSVGQRILTHPEVADRMAAAWDYPLMAWTDLNNTVVAGSLAIGLVSLLPAFALTYPIFKGWSRGLVERDRIAAEEARMHEQRLAANRAIRERERTQIAPAPARPTEAALPQASTGRVFDIRRVDESHTGVVPTPATTRIEVVPRQSLATASAALKSSQGQVVGTTAATVTASAGDESADEQQKIDEALRYLLRQLRDSQEKDAA